ncbi:MAG: TIM barrel protein [Oscillospiraceae bacterium]|nr:TIM barrel protein [Oscillospiraceae bacterium]
MVKLSACIEMLFKEYDFYERPAAVKAAGLDAVEFWGWADKDLSAMAQAAEKAGVKIAAACVGTRDEKRARAISEFGILDGRNAAVFAENVHETAEAFAPLGIPVIIVTTGQELPGVSREAQQEAVIRCLSAGAAIAQRAGVTLVVEPLNVLVNHGGYYLSSSHQAADILKAVNSPNVKMLFDVYHQQITEGNVIANLTEYMPLIGHIHTAGNPGRNELDSGELNYGPIFKAIENAGYTGYVGLEYSPTVHSGRSLAGAFRANA